MKSIICAKLTLFALYKRANGDFHCSINCHQVAGTVTGETSSAASSTSISTMANSSCSPAAASITTISNTKEQIDHAMTFITTLIDDSSFDNVTANTVGGEYCAGAGEYEPISETRNKRVVVLPSCTNSGMSSSKKIHPLVLLPQEQHQNHQFYEDTQSHHIGVHNTIRGTKDPRKKVGMSSSKKRQDIALVVRDETAAAVVTNNSSIVTATPISTLPISKDQDEQSIFNTVAAAAGGGVSTTATTPCCTPTTTTRNKGAGRRRRRTKRAMSE